MKLTKLLIFCCLSVLFSVYGQAQDVSISGKVIDENGLSIPGETILIKGTTKATSSNGIRGLTVFDAYCENNSLWAFMCNS